METRVRLTSKNASEAIRLMSYLSAQDWHIERQGLYVVVLCKTDMGHSDMLFKLSVDLHKYDILLEEGQQS